MNSVDARPLRTHFPGFDGLRLIAAVAVIFSHAFLIDAESEQGEPFVRLLGPGNILGLYGVFTFFVISGFLLARSLESNSSPIVYAVNRTLRILPGFVFCTVVTAFVVGPVFSSLPPSAYLTSPRVLAFVGWSLQTLNDSPLPGLFAYHSNADLVATVNGALWSLHYEALSYVFLLVLWMVLRGSGAVAAISGIIAGLTWAFPAAAARYVPSISYTLPYFASGILMHWIYRTYGTSGLAAACSVGGLVLSAVAGIPTYGFALFGAYLIVFAGERPNVGSTLAERVGDCSYGLYLYGWPAEQAVKQLTHTTSPWVLFTLATPLAFAFAAVSCHLIERPAMRMRAAA